MCLLSIAIDYCVLKQTPHLKQWEIGGRDQKEQLNEQTHTHVFVQNYFRIDETKLNEMKTQKKHKNSKKSFYKLTAEAPPSPSPPAEIIKIRRK